MRIEAKEFIGKTNKEPKTQGHFPYFLTIA